MDKHKKEARPDVAASERVEVKMAGNQIAYPTAHNNIKKFDCQAKMGVSH